MGEKLKVAKCMNLPQEGRAFLSHEGIVGHLSLADGRATTRYYACTKLLLEEELETGGTAFDLPEGYFEWRGGAWLLLDPAGSGFFFDAGVPVLEFPFIFTPTFALPSGHVVVFGEEHTHVYDRDGSLLGRVRNYQEPYLKYYRAVETSSRNELVFFTKTLIPEDLLTEEERWSHPSGFFVVHANFYGGVRGKPGEGEFYLSKSVKVSEGRPPERILVDEKDNFVLLHSGTVDIVSQSGTLVGRLTLPLEKDLTVVQIAIHQGILYYLTGDPRDYMFESYQGLRLASSRRVFGAYDLRTLYDPSRAVRAVSQVAAPAGQPGQEIRLPSLPSSLSGSLPEALAPVPVRSTPARLEIPVEAGVVKLPSRAPSRRAEGAEDGRAERKMNFDQLPLEERLLLEEERERELEIQRARLRRDAEVAQAELEAEAAFRRGEQEVKEAEVEAALALEETRLQLAEDRLERSRLLSPERSRSSRQKSPMSRLRSQLVARESGESRKSPTTLFQDQLADSGPGIRQLSVSRLKRLAEALRQAETPEEAVLLEAEVERLTSASRLKQLAEAFRQAEIPAEAERLEAEADRLTEEADRLQEMALEEPKTREEIIREERMKKAELKRERRRLEAEARREARRLKEALEAGLEEPQPPMEDLKKRETEMLATKARESSLRYRPQGSPLSAWAGTPAGGGNQESQLASSAKLRKDSDTLFDQIPEAMEKNRNAEFFETLSLGQGGRQSEGIEVSMPRVSRTTAGERTTAAPKVSSSFFGAEEESDRGTKREPFVSTQGRKTGKSRKTTSSLFGLEEPEESEEPEVKIPTLTPRGQTSKPSKTASSLFGLDEEPEEPEESEESEESEVKIPTLSPRGQTSKPSKTASSLFGLDEDEEESEVKIPAFTPRGQTTQAMKPSKTISSLFGLDEDEDSEEESKESQSEINFPALASRTSQGRKTAAPITTASSLFAPSDEAETEEKKVSFFDQTFGKGRQTSGLLKRGSRGSLFVEEGPMEEGPMEELATTSLTGLEKKSLNERSERSDLSLLTEQGLSSEGRNWDTGKDWSVYPQSTSWMFSDSEAGREAETMALDRETELITPPPLPTYGTEGAAALDLNRATEGATPSEYFAPPAKRKKVIEETHTETVEETEGGKTTKRTKTTTRKLADKEDREEDQEEKEDQEKEKEQDREEEKESETGVSRCTALTFCGYRCTRAALPEASMCRQHLKKSMSPPKQKEVEKPVKIGTCGYIMRNGKPCGNWPMKGKMHCYTHSGV